MMNAIPLHAFQMAVLPLMQFRPELTVEALQAAVNAIGASPAADQDAGEEGRYLGYSEAQRYTGLSRDTLRRAHEAGQLPAIKLSAARSGKVLFDRKDLDRWLRRHRSTGKARGGVSCP